MSTPLLQNILNQAEALREVSAFHFGPGRAALERAGDLLRFRKKALFSGMGASYFACTPFQYAFARLPGLSTNCVESAELLYFGEGIFNRETAAVLVSRSGESVEVSKLLGPIHEAGATVVGIGNVAGSTIDTKADVSLLLNSPADQLIAIQTYTATLAVLALLHAASTGELESARNELEQTSALLDGLIPLWVTERDEWHSFLPVRNPLYLLGRGPSLGAVCEGVLLMHETAKAPAVGMSIPQFRHGPVEVVDSDFRAVVIGTQHVTAELDSALANDLTRMGSQVRWLGPSVPGLQVQTLCAWPSAVPPRFASIVETIPLQILAYAQAERRGIRPGDFHWAPAITSTEAGFPAIG